MQYKKDNRNKRENVFVWHRMIKDKYKDTFEKEIEEQIDFLVKLFSWKIVPDLGEIKEIE